MTDPPTLRKFVVNIACYRRPCYIKVQLGEYLTSVSE
jgi:hypothetical protein